MPDAAIACAGDLVLDWWRPLRERLRHELRAWVGRSNGRYTRPTDAQRALDLVFNLDNM